MALFPCGSTNGGGGGTSDYSQLSNKPSINNVTLVGNKTSDDLGLEGAYTTITYAQWQAMTDAQRESGKYYVTDVPGYDVPVEDVFAPQIFSLSERQVGVWIDGKPLYQKTCNVATNTNCTNTSWTPLPLDNPPSNADYMIDAVLHGQCPNTNRTYRFQFNNGDVEVASLTSEFIPQNTKITFFYTKTTDTAGSGNWTPDGVPAVHYSTDEHVVGTWIDGSTIYEKTISCGSLPNNSTKVVGSLSNVLLVLEYLGFIYNSAKTAQRPLPFSDSGSNPIRVEYDNGDIRILTHSDWSSYSGYITVRYTKAS